MFELCSSHFLFLRFSSFHCPWFRWSILSFVHLLLTFLLCFDTFCLLSFRNDTLHLFYGLFLHYFWHSSFSVKSFRHLCSKLLAFLGFSHRSFWWSFVLSFIFLTDVVYWFVFSFSHSCCVLKFCVYYLFERYSLFVLWFVFSTIFYILHFLFKVSGFFFKVSGFYKLFRSKFLMEFCIVFYLFGGCCLLVCFLQFLFSILFYILRFLFKVSDFFRFFLIEVSDGVL